MPELVRSFAAAGMPRSPTLLPPSGSLIDRLLASASTIVKVKPGIEAATGDSPSAVLARAEALIDKGDFAGSVKQIEILHGAPREAFSAWLAEARLGSRPTIAKGSKRHCLPLGAPEKAQKTR